MAQKRSKTNSNGEGTVYKLPDGRWRASVTVGLKADGTPIRKSRIGRSRADAVALRDELKRAAGFRVSAPTRGIRVEQYLTEWLAGVEARCAPGTTELYRNSVVKHIVPHLGSIRLEDLAPVHIERWVVALGSVGPRARQAAFSHLKRALKRAVQLQLIPASPMEGTQAPSHRRKQPVPFSAEEVSKIEDWFQLSYWHLFVQLAFRTGLRQGELLGLQWGDLQGETLRIERQSTEKGGIQPLKTESSRREVPLTGLLTLQLTEARAEAMKRGRAAKEELIFQGPRGGRLLRRNFLGRWWKPCLKELGLDYRGPHHTRHTFATLLLNGGESLPVVSKILGHSKPSVTLDIYAHVLRNDIEKARATIDRVFAVG